MKLNNLFRNGVVFQAGKPIRIFGSGDGVAEICFMGKTYKTISEHGKWLLEIPPMQYGGPYEMTCRLSGKETVISDLYIGEVLLIAGQSNVQFRVGEESPAREYEQDKLLRFFAVERIEEDDECFRESDGWQDATGDKIKKHSSIGYRVGQRLRERTGAAVGIVECYQGASVIQSWMKKSDTEREEFYIPMNKRHQDFTNEGYKTYLRWNEDGKLFENMLLRIAPFSFSGVVWYQGESNTSVSEGEIYDKMLLAMIKSWRAALNDLILPFAVVVIANLDCRNDDGWRAVQAAQRRVGNLKQNIVTVESADISDSSTIHPPDKIKLSERIFFELEKIMSATQKADKGIKNEE